MQSVLRRGVFLALALVFRAQAAVAEPPLQSLAATVGAEQGVYAVAADGSVLVAQAEAHAVHPASVTKIATSLALLARLGPDHRFTTRFRAAGPLRDGRIGGDLVVEAGGDPFFVDETALLALRRLRALGVRVVAGELVVRGPLLFDWQPDPNGRRLAAVLAGRAAIDTGRMLARLGLPADAAPPLTFAPPAHRAAAPARSTAAATAPSPAASDDERTLVTLRSPPLLHVAKALNCFSNNVFHLAAAAIGGPAVVQEIARARVPAALRDEIIIDNGAGAGATNRLSPRAAVALLAALDDELRRSGHELSAVLPVSKIDPGTLQDRFREQPALVVGKTGTFGSQGASALVGVLQTRRYGTVRFAVLNHAVPTPDARARQDAFVRALAVATDATPWPYTTRMDPPYLETVVE